ncbi:tyrosine-type recombinase/integrase [Nitrosophilus labii]|uniref:tyrosine-type recombinase/integrase n=1 Tax=Nitrosophilus labii TaxID=2706014 RepID=UPI0016573536|nr:integrase arm-type DNA-binding domain-containing protein [Nitrosophilus labii]
MPKVVKPLTDKTIKEAKTKEKEYKIPDGDHLYLRVRPSGTKTFVFIYNSPIDGKRKTLTIGTYPQITLKQAREARDKANRLLAQNLDPILEREKEKFQNNLTFQTILYEFIQWRSTKVKENTLKSDKKRINNYIIPFFGNKKLTDIEISHLLEFIKYIQNKKFNKDNKSSSNKIDTIQKNFILLNLIFKYAINKQYIKNNPLTNFDLSMVIGKKEEKHYNSLTKAEDMRDFLSKLQKADIPLIAKLAIEFQALTAQRVSNVVNLKWKYIDFSNNIITFPKETMKTNKEHRIPVTSRVKEILEIIKTQNFNDIFVFAYQRDKPITDSTINDYIQRINPNISSHSFRGTFRTIATEYIYIHGFSQVSTATQKCTTSAM